MTQKMPLIMQAFYAGVTRINERLPAEASSVINGNGD